MSDRVCAYAGVDWGSQNHCVFLTDGEGRKIGQRGFEHSGEGLAEMADWLSCRPAARRNLDGCSSPSRSRTDPWSRRIERCLDGVGERLTRRETIAAATSANPFVEREGAWV